MSNPAEEDSSFDIIVVGAGIAGLTAANTAAAHGARVAAVDQLAPGGQLINLGAVHGFPGLPEKTTGPDLAGRLLEETMEAGADIRYGEIATVRFDGPAIAVASEEETLYAKSVIAATGLAPGRLEISGTDSDSWIGRGLSECASCDGPLYSGQQVAVVGTDAWAAQEALELTAFASRVVLLAPTAQPTWPAALAKRLNGAVEIRTDVRVTGLEGSSRLSAVRLDDGSTLEVAAVFPILGKLPRVEPFLDVLVRDDDRRLRENADRGLFVAGDVRAGSEPYLVAAAADGLRAALAALHFIVGG